MIKPLAPFVCIFFLFAQTVSAAEPNELEKAFGVQPSCRELSQKAKITHKGQSGISATVDYELGLAHTAQSNDILISTDWGDDRTYEFDFNRLQITRTRWFGFTDLINTISCISFPLECLSYTNDAVEILSVARRKLIVVKTMDVKAAYYQIECAQQKVAAFAARVQTLLLQRKIMEMK